MPSTPQPPRRSWRDDASGNRGPTKREWQKEGGGSGGGPRLSRRMKIILAASSLVGVLVGVLVMWWMIRRTDPPRLVLIGAGYETNLAVPHNVHGKRALADLKGWADKHNEGRAGDPEHSIDVKQ